MAYQYTPLPPGTIRLLSLSPSPSKTAPLEGTFLPTPLSSPSATVSVAAPPPFSSLSYVWGPQTFPSSIKITSAGAGGGDLPLPLPTANLDAALRRFRLPDAPRLLWADAICINQQDISERNAQVLLMADIYRTADTTLCWLGLGAGTGSEEGALRTLSEIAELGPRFGQPARGMPPERGAPIGTELDLGDIDMEEAGEVVELAVGGETELVFGNEWFERLWIVQEAVLAREMRMVLGEAEIEW
ncbi:heterokaryon incompatibility protein-domain-containing protein, partial [Parachaetomium inaequale]